MRLVEAEPGKPADRCPGPVRRFDPSPGVAITVVMPDGATPAFGARALFFRAGGREPIAEGPADAAGRLTWAGTLHSGRDEEEKPEPVKEPTIIAWVPGLASPAVATMKADEPLRLVLPAAAVASGRVTIGGRPVEGSESQIRVVLAAEGRGAVDVVMRRETVADAAGPLRFIGPAPGRYVVQAVREELWVSKPVPLVVEAGKEAAPIELDVPEPGSSMALRLVDRRGEPVAASFSIPRSDGPNAALPAIAARTDGRGEAILRGLPAGVATLTVEGDPTPHALDVPPARLGVGPMPVALEVDRRTP